MAGAGEVICVSLHRTAYAAVSFELFTTHRCHLTPRVASGCETVLLQHWVGSGPRNCSARARPVLNSNAGPSSCPVPFYWPGV